MNYDPLEILKKYADELQMSLPQDYDIYEIIEYLEILLKRRRMSRKQSPSMLLLDQHRQEIEALLNNKASVALLVRKFGTSANTMKKVY